jgi:leader peptidase (prepilin peptidase)/N-methyltransferase
VVAVCGIGGAAAGPFLDSLARRVRRPPAPAAELPSAADATALADPRPALTDPRPALTDPRPALADPRPALAEDGAPLLGAPAPVPPSPPPAKGAPGRFVEASPSARAGVVVEAAALGVLGALACALAAVRLGAVPQLAAYCVLAGALAVLAVTDLRTGLVPRRIVYAASALVGIALLAASAANGEWRPMLDALIGAAVAFGVFGAVWWVSPKAMGFGDVRLAGLCGGALGWLGFSALYLGFLASFVIGALMGVVVLLLHGRRRFPFAPALAVGTMFGVLWGAWLGGLWLHVR